eukprot:CAMPEP_0114560308 /NCGR_PEP_ID=MMETSP0114-20121206/11390_1 /TAXON_ID=31324 /ORGANISM="Goniomonas sp, Strain m" /LENGTH=675 /DNA_ID=CAMNT_0001745845 /DNA_START=219 /DNA_END=2246 /DNA_ORIENTATION=+
MVYQGRSYKIPVDVFVPCDYPGRPPTFVVKPEPPGIIPPKHIHVSEQGIVYMPYLHEWNSKAPSNSNLVHAVQALVTIFAQRPFVVLPNPQQQPGYMQGANAAAQPPYASTGGQQPSYSLPLQSYQVPAAQQPPNSYTTPPYMNPAQPPVSSGPGWREPGPGGGPGGAGGSPLGWRPHSMESRIQQESEDAAMAARLQAEEESRLAERANSQNNNSSPLPRDRERERPHRRSSGASPAAAGSSKSRGRRLSLLACVGDSEVKKRCDLQVDTCDTLIEHLKSRLSIRDEVTVMYKDPQFNEFVLLEETSWGSMPDNATVKVLTKQKPENNSGGGGGGGGDGVQYFKEIDYTELKISNKIGGGSYKTVFIGSWRGTRVAIGQLSKAAAEQTDLDEFRHELHLLAQLRHPNIVTLLGASTSPEAPAMCVVTELMSRGSLYDVIHKNKLPLSQQVKWEIMVDMCRGLNFLHHSQVWHRDIKSLNILIDDKYTAKLTDFGLSKKKEVEEGAPSMVQTKCGTSLWMAPEIMEGKPYNAALSDVYAMGLVCYEVVEGRLPYDHVQNDFQLMIEVCQKGNKPKINNPDCPKGLLDLLNWMWNRDPESRPDMDIVVNHLHALQENPSHEVGEGGCVGAGAAGRAGVQEAWAPRQIMHQADGGAAAEAPAPDSQHKARVFGSGFY